MHKLQIDSILLFSLIIPFIMTVRLGIGETPFWLFALIFFGMLMYLVADVIGLSKDTHSRVKITLLCTIIVAVLGSAFWSAMYVRHTLSPVHNVHDIVIQQEAAIRYFLDGINPYAADYFGTPLEEWHYSETSINPALYHYVMQPFYHLFALPFYWLSFRTVGFFDARMPLFFLLGVLLVNAGILVKDSLNRRLFIVLLAFNPAMLPYTLEGRSDMYMYAFLFAGFYLLYKKKYYFAGIPLALAFAVKQSAWPLFPLYTVYLYAVSTERKNALIKVRSVLYYLVPFALTFGAVVAPAYFWDPAAYIESTVLYLSGSLHTSYPISGYGWGMVLYKLGLIGDLHGYYPFSVWQALLGVPVLVVLVRYTMKKPTVQKLIFSYGVFLMVYWYFSRYFNNSHIGYLSVVFITAYFWPNQEVSSQKRRKINQSNDPS